MTKGIVNPQLEATVPITLVTSARSEIELTAIIDTGYSGYLAIPKRMALEYGLTRLLPRKVKLGDGTRKSLDYFSGEVLWNGHKSRIRILATKDEFLLGLGLLAELRLNVRFRIGDPVVVS